LGNRTFKQGDPGIGYAGKTVHPPVRNFLVAFNATLSFANLSVHCHRCFQFRIHKEFFMATDAIALHDPGPGFQDSDHLPFHTQGEEGGMTQTIIGFEIILIENIVVRNMTIVAVCILAVGTVCPRGILRGHDVAVDTCFGSVGEVEVSLPQIHGK